MHESKMTTRPCLQQVITQRMSGTQCAFQVIAAARQVSTFDLHQPQLDCRATPAMPMKSSLGDGIDVLSSAKECVRVSHETRTKGNETEFVVKPCEFIGVQHPLFVLHLDMRARFVRDLITRGFFVKP